MILSISSSAAYSVECLGLKPYWLGKKIQYSSKYDDNCLCRVAWGMTAPLKEKGILDMIGSR